MEFTTLKGIFVEKECSTADPTCDFDYPHFAKKKALYLLFSSELSSQNVGTRTATRWPSSEICHVFPPCEISRYTAQKSSFPSSGPLSARLIIFNEIVAFQL